MNADEPGRGTPDDRGALTTLILGRTAPRAADAVLAAGWASPAAVAARDAELERWCAAVRAAGIEYPLSPVAVEDLAAMADGRLADLQQAERQLGAVAALADRLKTGHRWNRGDDHVCGADRSGTVEYTCQAILDLDAVLGPVSGAVERAGDDPRPAELLASCIETDHDCPGSADYGACSGEDETVKCPCACHAAPVAGHEQEVRAEDERPVDLNAVADHLTDLVDQIGEVGIWGDYGPPAAPVSYVVQVVLDNATAIQKRTGEYDEDEAAARASGASAPAQGGAES
jgi:hypothetical protein